MGNLTNWVLGTTELAKSCGYNSTGNGKTFRVFIPKIQPLMSFGSPSSVSVALNRNCFCNASNCKPSISTTVVTSNFIEAIANGYDSTLNVYYEVLEEPLRVKSVQASLSASHGQTLKVSALNGNVDNLQVISKM